MRVVPGDGMCHSYDLHRVQYLQADLQASGVRRLYQEENTGGDYITHSLSVLSACLSTLCLFVGLFLIQLYQF